MSSTPVRITPQQLHESHRWFRLDELQQLPGNPNRGDRDSLESSVGEFGWIDGIVVHDGVVVAGNHRLEQAAARGETGLPGYDLTAVVPDLPAARRMAMALAHNYTTRAGSNDGELLAEALTGIAVEDIDLADVAGYNDLSGGEYAALAAAAEAAGLPLPLSADPPPPENYTRRIESPVYEPTGDRPPLGELFETDQRDRLVAGITEYETAGRIPADVAEFLRAAAERHVRFRFDRIAEYYAHAESDTQQLIEDSALVIIDFDRAIELGYVKLTEQLLAQFDVDAAAFTERQL